MVSKFRKRDKLGGVLREVKMKKIYGFRTFEEADSYADKNYNVGSYKVVETNSGTFAIEKEDYN